MIEKSKIKKEFDEFAQKVARLESLKKRFEALDTKGYEKEARVIRAKLKDTNAIPSIERNLNELEAKISSAAPVRTVKVRDEKCHKLNKKINELKEEIKTKKKAYARRQVKKKEEDFSKEISKLENEIRALLFLISGGDFRADRPGCDRGFRGRPPGAGVRAGARVVRRCVPRRRPGA